MGKSKSKSSLDLISIIMLVGAGVILLLMFALDVVTLSVEVLEQTTSTSTKLWELEDDKVMLLIATLLLITPSIFRGISFLLDSKKQEGLMKIISMVTMGIAVVGIVLVCVTLFGSETLLGVTAKSAPTITTWIAMILSLASVGYIGKEIFLDNNKK